MSRRRLRPPTVSRALLTGTALMTAAGLALVAPATTAQAQPLPASYQASAHGDLVFVDAALLGGSLATVPVGHTATTVDSSIAGDTANVHAEAANVDADLLGALPITVDSTEADAAPDSDPAGEDLLPVPLAPLADAAVVHGDVEAHYAGDAACPTLVGGERLLGRSLARTAAIDLVSVPGVGSVGTIGAVETTSETKLVPNGTGSSNVVSETTTTVGDISLLAGQVLIRVSDNVVTTATSDGATGTATRSNFIVTVLVGGTEVASIPSTNTDMTTIPVSLVGLNVDLKVGVGTFQDTSAGATGSGHQDAVVKVALNVTTALGGDVVNLNIAAGASDVSATAPTGGVECDAVAVDDTVIVAPVEGSITSDATPTITGTGEPGSTVTIVIDGGTPVDVTVDPDGNWTYTPTTPLADGDHTVTVDGDANGTGVDDTVTFTVDTTAPDAPVITAPADGSTIDDTTPTITGTGEAGAEVEVSIDGTVIGTTTVDGSGNWSLATTDPLAEGTHTVTATQTDEAGNVSDAGSNDFTVDTTAPDAPVITDPADGSTTNDTTPTITGTGEAGAEVEVSIDGTVIGTTTVDGSGNWSLATTDPLAEGTHTVTATQTDEAGNTSAADAVDFTVDTTAPDATVITDPVEGEDTNDATPTITGTGEPGSTVTIVIDGGTPVDVTVDPDGNWTYTPTTPLADGDHTVTVDGDANGTGVDDTVTFTVDTTAPDAPVITAPADGSTIDDTTPTITGTGEAGAEVEVSIDGTVVGTTTVDGSGNWSLATTDPLADGLHTVTATQTDEAGNVSDAGSNDFTVDTTAPVAETVIVSPGGGSTVTDTTPTISGTGEPGSTVTIVIDGGTPVDVVVDPDGNWTYTPTTPLDEGDHTVTVDGDANGTGVDDTVTFTVDSDTDDDGLPDDLETEIGTDPSDPDTDNDGLTDGEEYDGVAACSVGKTDPLDPDTDNDRLKDGREVNGIRIKQKVYYKTGVKVRGKRIGRVHTDPCVRDTDGDRLSDGREVRGSKIGQRIIARDGVYVVRKRKTDPTVRDTDRDGLTDKQEVTGSKNKKFDKRKTDPTRADTDKGGIKDGREIRAGSDPTNVKSGPKRPRAKRISRFAG